MLSCTHDVGIEKFYNSDIDISIAVHTYVAPSFMLMCHVIQMYYCGFNAGQKLLMHKKKKNGWKLSLYSSCWIVNKTGLTLEYKVVY